MSPPEKPFVACAFYLVSVCRSFLAQMEQVGAPDFGFCSFYYVSIPAIQKSTKYFFFEIREGIFLSYVRTYISPNATYMQLLQLVVAYTAVLGNDRVLSDFELVRIIRTYTWYYSSTVLIVVSTCQRGYSSSGTAVLFFDHDVAGRGQNVNKMHV